MKALPCIVITWRAVVCSRGWGLARHSRYLWHWKQLLVPDSPVVEGEGGHWSYAIKVRGKSKGKHIRHPSYLESQDLESCQSHEEYRNDGEADHSAWMCENPSVRHYTCVWWCKVEQCFSQIMFVTHPQCPWQGSSGGLHRRGLCAYWGPHWIWQEAVDRGGKRRYRTQSSSLRVHVSESWSSTGTRSPHIQ